MKATPWNRSASIAICMRIDDPLDECDPTGMNALIIYGSDRTGAWKRTANRYARLYDSYQVSIAGHERAHVEGPHTTAEFVSDFTKFPNIDAIIYVGHGGITRGGRGALYLNATYNVYTSDVYGISTSNVLPNPFIFLDGCNTVTHRDPVQTIPSRTGTSATLGTSRGF